MTRIEIEQKYWRYYLLLESRFIETLSFVELHTDNYTAFSNNYALLIQAIGAELDTMFKIYCGFNTDDRKSIIDYIKAIDEEENNVKPQHAIDHPFRTQTINVTGQNITVQPFRTWDIGKPAQSLPWWEAFDKLKHNRFESRKLANQENCLNILGALLFIEMKMLKKITEGTEEIDIFNKTSELFTLPYWSNKVIPMENAFGIIAEMVETDGKNIPQAVDV